jgi:peptidoglycan/LPS O-acetylase OafA/YrhL
VFFWESWSLCIEEWFYFLFPLSLFLLNKFNSNKTIIFITCIILFFVFSISTKFHYINTHSVIDMDLYLRKLVITRFDTLCFGLFIAFIELTQLDFLKKIKWMGLIIFCSYMIIGNKPLQHHLYIVHFLFSALACSGLLIFCYSFKNGNKVSVFFAEFISKISYSMYLVHLPVLYILNFVVSKNYSNAPILYFISYIFVVITLSFLNYKYFELYFLKRRNS